MCGTQRMELAVLLVLLVRVRERLLLARQQISLVDVEVLQRLAGQCQIDVQRISAVLPGIRQYGQTAICLQHTSTLVVKPLLLQLRPLILERKGNPLAL